MRNLYGNGLAILFFVLLPGLVTMMAPVSWIDFERNDSNVTATVQSCTFFFIPFRSQHIAAVMSVRNRLVEGAKQRRRPGQTSPRSQMEGFVDIAGANTEISIPVAPSNVESITRKIQAFLDDGNQKSLHLVTVANWIVGVFFGVFFSLFTVLYVIALCWGIVVRIGRRRSRRFGST